MGAGASLDVRGPHSPAYNIADAPVLTSLSDLAAAHEADLKRFAGRRTKDGERRFRATGVLNNQQRHHQPLLRDKLNRSLFILDDVRSAFSEDQVRCKGFTEVAKGALTAGGAVRALCVCDSSTIACASVGGPIWVYDWREGVVISQMRQRGHGRAHSGAGWTDGSVVRLCLASEDAGVLASGDEHGFLAFWDLSGPSLAVEARLHGGAITGLRRESESGQLYTTSEDTYLMVYDARQQAVIDRAKPQSCSCGDGIPSTTIGIAGAGRSKLLLVGGADGKLRVWSKDSAALRRQHTLTCGMAKPTQCLMASDGWTAVVSTAPADLVLCSGQPSRGGLLAYDLRKLGGDGSAAVVAQYRSEGAGGLPKAPPGSVDMTLVEEDGETIALCLTDGVVRAFNLGRAVGGVLQPMTVGEHEVSPSYDFDVLSQHEGQISPMPYPCAITSVDRFVFTTTTAPSVSVWHRNGGGEQVAERSHLYQPSPLALVARCVPQRPPGETPSEILEGWEEVQPRFGRAGAPPRGAFHLAAPQAAYGEALARVQASLQRDRWMAGLAEGAAPTEALAPMEDDQWQPERPEAPTPTAMAGHD